MISNAFIQLFVVLFLLWLCALCALIWRHRVRLLRLWREPVLTEQPVFILESDDWGAGPPAQSDALDRMVALLQGFTNKQGVCPLVTLAVVLKVAACGENGRDDISLSDDEMEAIRKSIQSGVDKKIFFTQLHGMYHYWPATVSAWEDGDASRKAWRQSRPYAKTESLPAYLQSRWTNVLTLPSCEHADDAVEYAVKEETGLFETVFSKKPTVVVPPTFQWTETVEQAWTRHGVGTVVTPGRRYTMRDRDGRLVEDKTYPIYNGLKTMDDLVYLVRDVYFEPARGHRAADVINDVIRRYMLRRPALVEMHRDNFLDALDLSLDKLTELMQKILTKYPDVRFVSTERLSQSIRNNDPVFIETRWHVRFMYFMLRLRADFSLRHITKLSGLSVRLRLSST